MKRMKKLASLFLAMVMVLSMTVAAFAEGETNRPTGVDDGDFSIKLNGKTSGYQYSAYQIFKGDLLEKNVDATTGEAKGGRVLSNVEWGDSVTTSDNLVTALKEIMPGLDQDNKIMGDTGLTATEKYSKIAKSVAEILGSETNRGKDSDLARKFAKVMGDYINTSNASASAQSDAGVAVDENGVQVTFDKDGKPTATIDRYVYTISGLTSGYYLVQDTADTVGEGEAYTRYIMEVVANVTANVKAEVPTIEKKIITGFNANGNAILADANTASVGHVVTYEIYGTVPNYTDYDKYFYVINDKLSDGLTFNEEDGVTVTVEGSNGIEKVFNANEYHLYTQNTEIKADASHTFEVAFGDIKALLGNDYIGKKIKVRYSATVNGNAVVGSTGNSNEVTLTYSNNPNNSGIGENDEKPGTPDPDHPTGESPKDKTITYVAEIDITKTFDGKTLPLGAEFTLTGTVNQVVLKDKTYFEPATADEVKNGTVTKYWLLKNGGYTMQEPRAEVIDPEGNVTDYGNIADYVNPRKPYVKKTAKSSSEVPSEVKMVAVTDENGKISFSGLGKGTFTIEETFVPAGYNKAETMTVVIECTVPDEVKLDETDPDANKATWSKGSETSANVTLKNSKDDGTSNDANYEITIDNKSGALLPSTGGIGRTIFYAAGIILMAGAMFFVVRRKRA